LKQLQFFLEGIRGKISKLLSKELTEREGIKVSFQLFIEANIATKNLKNTICLNTKNRIVLQSTDLDDLIDDIFKDLERRSETFVNVGSGWTVVNVEYIQVNISDYRPLRGSGGNTFIETPKPIKTKKGIINIKNKDSYCFLWSLTACMYNHLNPNKKIHDPNRISSYPHFSNYFDYDKFNFPMGLDDL
jgi:hypothetical protein